MKIALMSLKGGSGKTTLSIHLAAALCRRGRRVLLVDADPQGSALDWSAARQNPPAFPVVGLPRASLHRELPGLAEGYDAVVIDSPPRVYEIARSVLLASDVVLIPVQPSPLDLWATTPVLETLQEASVYKETQKHAFVVTRKIVGTAIGREMATYLTEANLPHLRSSLCQRVIIPESMARGQTVFDLEPDGAAAFELDAITDEVLSLV